MKSAVHLVLRWDNPPIPRPPTRRIVPESFLVRTDRGAQSKRPLGLFPDQVGQPLYDKEIDPPAADQGGRFAAGESPPPPSCDPRVGRPSFLVVCPAPGCSRGAGAFARAVPQSRSLSRFRQLELLTVGAPGSLGAHFHWMGVFCQVDGRRVTLHGSFDRPAQSVDL